MKERYPAVSGLPGCAGRNVWLDGVDRRRGVSICGRLRQAGGVDIDLGHLNRSLPGWVWTSGLESLGSQNEGCGAARGDAGGDGRNQIDEDERSSRHQYQGDRQRGLGHSIDIAGGKGP